MKTKALKIAYFAVGLVVLFFIISLMLPASFRVEASVDIRAPLECPFNIVNNLHDWEYWDPYRKIDPDLEIAFSNPPTGEGAFARWESDNNRLGDGKLTITAMNPGKAISTEVSREDGKQFSSEFRFEQSNGIVTVTRQLDGTFGRAPLDKYGMLFSKGRIQKSLQASLDNMKQYCESR